jgi:hypothetical protein
VHSWLKQGAAALFYFYIPTALFQLKSNSLDLIGFNYRIGACAWKGGTPITQVNVQRRFEHRPLEHPSQRLAKNGISPTPESYMDALNDIGEWFQNRFKWEKTAYHLILSQSPLDKEAIERLADECEAEASAGKKKGGKLENKEETAVPTDTVVRLLVIKNVQNVNRLVVDQTLSFSPNGMTVVYGDNGAGKTGYGRILRQVCRSRGVPPVLLPNVFADSIGAASADVTFSVDGQESSVSIRDGLAPTSALQNISIFDSKAAATLIDKENDAAFRPYGLAVLDAYIKLVDEVRDCLQKRENSLSAALVDVSTIPENTALGNFLRRLNASNTEQELERLAVPLSEEDLQRQAALKEIIKKLQDSDPKKLAAIARTQSSRFTTLKERLAKIETALGTEAVKRIKDLRRDTIAAKKAAEDARNKAFNGETLEGIGSESWKRLWEAAREFSDKVAAEGETFPNTKPGTVCILCAQPLEAKAVERFKTLEAYVTATLKGEAAALETKSENAIKYLENIKTEDDQDQALIDELESEFPGQSADLKRYLEAARSLQASAVALLKDGTDTGEGLSGIPKTVQMLIDAANSKAEEYDKVLKAGKNDEQISELAELDARSALFKLKGQVVCEIQRLRRLEGVKRAISSTATAAASRLSGTLTTKYVTESLCKRFEDEIRAFGLNHLRAELSSLGIRKGNARHRVLLKSKRPADLRDVVSEGEFRSLALAAFLAEVGANNSGICRRSQ